MKKPLILILLVVSCINTKVSQENNERVDSFFKETFSVLQVESKRQQGITVPFDKSNHVLISVEDSLYMLKGIAEALAYMEKLTSIKAAIKNPGQYTSSKYVDVETLNKWRDWYTRNRTNIVWDNKLKSPILKR